MGTKCVVPDRKPPEANDGEVGGGPPVVHQVEAIDPPADPAEALMVDTLHEPFVEAMDDLVLKPAEMSHSTFEQPLPDALRAKAVTGHLGDGTEVKGGFHVFPEHAAAGLWSTPTDIANLLLLIARAWRGESALFLTPETTRETLKAQWASLRLHPQQVALNMDLIALGVPNDPNSRELSRIRHQMACHMIG